MALDATDAQDVLEDALSHLSTYLEQAKRQGIPTALGDEETGGTGLLEYAVERASEAYGILEAASGTAPVTAGSSPGHASVDVDRPDGISCSASYRGVSVRVVLEDNPEHPDHLVVEAYISPPPRGLDTLLYTHRAVRAPEPRA